MSQAQLTCRRCNGIVTRYAMDYELLEGMHRTCFHYEFEHGVDESDADVACTDPSCPSRMIDRAARASGEE